jgi:hypothetical protein
MIDPTQPHHHHAGHDLDRDGGLGAGGRAAVVRP